LYFCHQKPQKTVFMLSDKDIIAGFRRGDSHIFRQYFYEYCHAAYYMLDKKYELSRKQNLDFMSLAHQYAIYLMEHDWKPLEDRAPSVSLRTWMINGFRFIVLDALKWYQREYGSLSFEEYLRSFDTSQNLRLNFNKMMLEICDTMPLDRKSRTILTMLLINGFKAKEVAAQLGITPAAVSQRLNKLKEEYIIPYFRKNFDMDFDMPEVMDVESVVYGEAMPVSERMVLPTATMGDILTHSINVETQEDRDMEKKRTTPAFINELAPGEIFVFGSNLRGMHGGGAAYVAYRKFGAIMGQGVGLQGNSYAIPTMQGGVETIKPYVDEFIDFARQHRELTFLVTRIGCGIAGFTDEEIAPLFVSAHDEANIVLPEGW